MAITNQLKKPYVASPDEKEAVQILVRNIVSAINEHEGSFDRTFKSVVVAIDNEKYTILDESGTRRTVKSSIPNLPIKIGTSVWVRIPCMNTSQMHICGIY